MMSPIQMFDVTPIQSGMQFGAQRGAVNSPFTPLGQALDKTLQKYEAGIAAQRDANAKMGLLNAEYGLKTDLAKKEAQMKYPWRYDATGNLMPVSAAGTYAQEEPQLLTRTEALDPTNPDNKTVFKSTKKFDPEKGLHTYSDWSPVPVDSVNYKQKFLDNIYRGMLTPSQEPQNVEAAKAAVNARLLEKLNELKARGY